MTNLYYAAVGLFTVTGLVLLARATWWLIVIREAVFDCVAEFWENFQS